MEENETGAESTRNCALTLYTTKDYYVEGIHPRPKSSHVIFILCCYVYVLRHLGETSAFFMRKREVNRIETGN